MLPTWYLYAARGQRRDISERKARSDGMTICGRQVFFRGLIMRFAGGLVVAYADERDTSCYTLQSHANDTPCKREARRKRFNSRVAASARACRLVLPREKSASARFFFLFSLQLHLHRLEPVLSKLLLRLTRAPLHQRCFPVACPRVSRRAGSPLSPASRLELQHAPPWPQPQRKNLDRARVHRHWSTYRSVGVIAVYVLPPVHAHRTRTPS